MFSLTSIKCDTCDTFSFTAFSLICFVTSSPFKYTLSCSFSVLNSIFIFCNNSFIFSVSSSSIFSFNIFNVTHLYIAPVSMFINPSFAPTSFVIVPFPLPAGPSIATTNDIFIPYLSFY